jgi:hypothetical protein
MGDTLIAGPQPTQDKANIYKNCEYAFMPIMYFELRIPVLEKYKTVLRPQ